MFDVNITSEIPRTGSWSFFKRSGGQLMKGNQSTLKVKHALIK